MKKIYTLLLLCFVFAAGYSQNWQYVGNSLISSNTSVSNTLYSSDLEFNATGDMFLAFYDYSGKTYFYQNVAGTWTEKTSPGTFVGNFGTNIQRVDIEVSGSNYYYSYANVRGSNMWAYVLKYNGTGWDMVGDSLSLGNSGSGGHFDLVLDNSGTPTVLGVANGTNREVRKFNGTAWELVYSIPNPAGFLYDEGTSVFDSQNKLYAIAGNYTFSPSLMYYNYLIKIDGNTATNVGDTISTTNGVINTRVKLDGTGTPYYFFNNTIAAKVMAYKLVNNKWSLAIDTTGITSGLLYGLDMGDNGEIAYYTLSLPNATRGMRIALSSTLQSMDSVNVNYFGIGGVGDVVIPNGSTDVYIAVPEIKQNSVQDYSIMKHSLEGTSTGLSAPVMENAVLIYPNPSKGTVTIRNAANTAVTLSIYNTNGQTVYSQAYTAGENAVVTSLTPAGLYIVEVKDATGAVHRNKLVVE